MQDKERKGNNEQLLHKKENADNLAQAEGLLKDLFMDVGGAKKLQHPQAKEIEKEWVCLGVSWPKFKHAQTLACMPSRQNLICYMPRRHTRHKQSFPQSLSLLSTHLLTSNLNILSLSVVNLHYRWAKDCATFREVYESVQDVDLTQKIGWGPLFDERLVSWTTKISATLKSFRDF